jgi:hypothetical protein
VHNDRKRKTVIGRITCNSLRNNETNGNREADASAGIHNMSRWTIHLVQPIEHWNWPWERWNGDNIRLFDPEREKPCLLLEDSANISPASTWQPPKMNERSERPVRSVGFIAGSGSHSKFACGQQSGSTVSDLYPRKTPKMAHLLSLLHHIYTSPRPPNSRWIYKIAPLLRAKIAGVAITKKVSFCQTVSKPNLRRPSSGAHRGM